MRNPILINYSCWTSHKSISSVSFFNGSSPVRFSILFYVYVLTCLYFFESHSFFWWNKANFDTYLQIRNSKTHLTLVNYWSGQYHICRPIHVKSRQWRIKCFPIKILLRIIVQDYFAVFFCNKDFFKIEVSTMYIFWRLILWKTPKF